MQNTTKQTKYGKNAKHTQYAMADTPNVQPTPVPEQAPVPTPADHGLKAYEIHIKKDIKLPIELGRRFACSTREEGAHRRDDFCVKLGKRLAAFGKTHYKTPRFASIHGRYASIQARYTTHFNTPQIQRPEAVPR